jgi:hypothetical protein
LATLTGKSEFTKLSISLLTICEPGCSAAIRSAGRCS